MLSNAAALAMAGGEKVSAPAAQVFHVNIAAPSSQAFAASQGWIVAVLARAAAQGRGRGECG